MERVVKSKAQPDGRYTIYAEAEWLPKSDPKRKLVMQTDVDARFVVSAMIQIGRAHDFHVLHQP